MQFHIRTLLIVMVAVSLLCGLVFAAPPIVCLPVLIMILWVCPAVWLNGIVYGRGAWQAFFIGGFIAGLAPHLGALYYSVNIVGSFFVTNTWDELWDELLEVAETPYANLQFAVPLLAPGLFAFLGGITGAVTYWMLQPSANPSPEGPLAADEYLIVSGRLTTTPVERQK